MSEIWASTSLQAVTDPLHTSHPSDGIQNTSVHPRDELVRDLLRILFPFVIKVRTQQVILGFEPDAHPTKGEDTFKEPETQYEHAQRIPDATLRCPGARSEQNTSGPDECEMDTSVTWVPDIGIWAVLDQFMFGTDGDLECEEGP